jgi:hypothetical protein
MSKEESKGSGEQQKRPMTPFFLFKAEEADRGNKMNGKDAGKIWKEMPEEKKQPYIEQHRKAKEAYEKYMVEVEGYSPKKAGKPNYINKSRVRVVCTSLKDIRPMTLELYRGLAKVMVR